MKRNGEMLKAMSDWEWFIKQILRLFICRFGRGEILCFMVAYILKIRLYKTVMLPFTSSLVYDSII